MTARESRRNGAGASAVRSVPGTGPVRTLRYRTEGGLDVECSRVAVPVPGALDEIVAALDARLGMALVCDTEFPGRYQPTGVGFIDPPLRIEARAAEVVLTPLNERGHVILDVLDPVLRADPAVRDVADDGAGLTVTAAVRRAGFAEEDRSRQPSVFSVLRAVTEVFASPADEHLGLYGAFGYDLAFQLEPVRLRSARPAWHRDLVLYLPDDLVVVDHRRGTAERRRYEFRSAAGGTHGLPRTGSRTPWTAGPPGTGRGTPPGGYAAMVRQARSAFARGDLFEVVLSQTFLRGAERRPSDLFTRLRVGNPSPYGFLVHLGDGEHLVGSSPEMYVRVSGRRVETVPLSGTAARGIDPMADADQVLALLSSAKDAAELTMCTDVDRNDKSRICVPGSVALLGRRQIEMYSRLIHTADHVVGELRPDRDGLDALLAHAWAVTVTGAPKAWAMQFVEDHEHSVRGWYGGAVGVVGFDGHVDTGLTIRTVHLRDGVAEVRAGATLLFDSDPDLEERETELKASALLAALDQDPVRPPSDQPAVSAMRGHGSPNLLLVDHQDSFVHTLGGYFREAGAAVRTLRAPLEQGADGLTGVDLVVLSPGPGRPADFDTSATITEALRLRVPVFGVCLGLQAIVEYFGGSLRTLDEPVHGKASSVTVTGGRLLSGLPPRFRAARYHSLVAAVVPDCLEVTAVSDEGEVMAVEHRTLPIAAVQFHPESILSVRDRVGHRVIDAVLRELVTARTGRVSA